MKARAGQIIEWRIEMPGAMVIADLAGQRGMRVAGRTMAAGPARLSSLSALQHLIDGLADQFINVTGRDPFLEEYVHDLDIGG